MLYYFGWALGYMVGDYDEVEASQYQNIMLFQTTERFVYAAYLHRTPVQI